MKDDLHDFGLCLLMLAALVAVMFWIGTPAHSQERQPGPPCARAVDMQDQLQKEYGETVTAGGIIGDQFMVIMTNKKTGTFTVIMRRMDGVGCMVLGGTGFALADPAPVKGNGL